MHSVMSAIHAVASCEGVRVLVIATPASMYMHGHSCIADVNIMNLLGAYTRNASHKYIDYICIHMYIYKS